MKKFSEREELIILKSLKKQLDVEIKAIEDIESKGKRAFITTNYIRQEFKQLSLKIHDCSKEIKSEKALDSIDKSLRNFNYD